MNQKLLSAGISFMAVLALGAPAAAQTQLWIRQFGTSATDDAWALCPDGAGGAFVAGSTGGSLGGPGAGALDAWLARYDSAGSRTWIRQFGTSATDDTSALCPDGADGAFVAGSTDGSLGGPSAGEGDVWLARYNSAGNRTWIRQFGTSDFEWAHALCPDGAGGAFVAGETYGSLGGPNAGVPDAWLARYDSAGNRTWIRQFGTSDGDQAGALCPDGAGGAFVAGWTYGNLGAPAAGFTDVWLARYDSAGNRTWVRQFGTNGDDGAYALCADGAGGAFIAGETDRDLGGPNSGYYDAWLAHYDSAGSRTWIRQFGSGDDDLAGALCPDSAGGAFLAGYTGGSLGGPGAGLDDAWLARYDSAGSRTWIRQFGTSGIDSALALCPDDAGRAFVAGYTSGSLGGPGAGMGDVWLARYGESLRGDLNCDGEVNVLDVPAFALALTDPAGYAAQYQGCDIRLADVNADGLSDGRDVALFVAAVIGP